MAHRPVEPSSRPGDGQRGQGTRLGPAHRAPRGLLRPGAVDGQGDRDLVGRCAPHPPSRARSGPAHVQYRPRLIAPVQPPHTRALASPPLPCPPRTRALASPPLPCPPRTPRSCPIRSTRPARPPVGIRRSLAGPSAATSKVAASGAANERVGPKRRRVFTLPRPLPFGRYFQRHSRTVEAAAAAETPAVYRRQRRNLCPHHHCHPPCHHRSRVRHHRRHPRLNDHSLPTPRTGRAHLAPSPPPPPSISKARRRRSRHRHRRHRPCHHLGRHRRRCRALRRVGGPKRRIRPSVKQIWACNGHFSGPLWS